MTGQARRSVLSALVSSSSGHSDKTAVSPSRRNRTAGLPGHNRATSVGHRRSATVTTESGFIRRRTSVDGTGLTSKLVMRVRFSSQAPQTQRLTTQGIPCRGPSTCTGQPTGPCYPRAIRPRPSHARRSRSAGPRSDVPADRWRAGRSARRPSSSGPCRALAHVWMLRSSPSRSLAVWRRS
jgi:hypothetical protein